MTVQIAAAVLQGILVAERTVRHLILHNGCRLRTQIAPRAQQGQSTDHLRLPLFFHPTVHRRHGQIATGAVAHKNKGTILLRQALQRTVHVLMSCGVDMAGGQTVFGQHHLATGGPGQMNGCGPVHPRAAKRKGSTVHPHDGAFVVLFPSDLCSSPDVVLPFSKFTAPRSWIQARSDFNRLPDLLWRCLCHVPSKDPSRAMGAFEPSTLGAPVGGKPWLGWVGRKIGRHGRDQGVNVFISYTGYRLAVPSL